MRQLALVVLLASVVSAAPTLEPVVVSSTTHHHRPAFKPGPPPLPKAPAPRTGDPYWFKVYSTAPYKEVWTGDLALKDFSRDLPNVVAAIQAQGGALTEPLKGFVSDRKDQIQQLTFDVPVAKTKDLVKALRDLGDMPDPAVRAMGAPIPLDEIRVKIAAMMKEKTERAAELAKVPAAAAAEEEILEHLLMVEEVGARVVVRARVNLTVRQK